MPFHSDDQTHRYHLPCRWYYALIQWATYPSFTCIIAYDTSSYNNFTGNPNSYSSITTWSTTVYNTTGPKAYSWVPNAACTTAYPVMCEIPKAHFDCSTSPPPVPPPAPYDTGLCEYPTAVLSHVVEPTVQGCCCGQRYGRWDACCLQHVGTFPAEAFAMLPRCRSKLY
jgi:hypothetical protein